MAAERKHHRGMKAALAFLAITSASCSLIENTPPATMEVRAERSATLTWPFDSGNRVRFNNDLGNSAGLAGIRIEITGIGQDRTFVAGDFEAGIPAFGVPDSGTATFAATLTQDGEIAAEGAVSWELGLDPELRWTVDIGRVGYPVNADPDGDEWPENTRLRCNGWWCFATWRFAVREDFANYQGESLWITVWRYDPAKCVDVC